MNILARFWPLRILPLLLCPCAIPLAAAQTGPAIGIAHYRMDVVLDPSRHLLTAEVAVTFTALENTAGVSFELNPGLAVSSVTDNQGATLEATRISSDLPGAVSGENTIRVTPTSPLHRGDSATWTFTYSGVFDAAGGAAASAPKLAAIGEPVSYLLYAARWFPMVGYKTDRFTSTMQVHVPVGERVLASGLTGSPHRDAKGQTVFDFQWTHSGFPGTVIAGRFSEPYSADAGSNVRVYPLEEKSSLKNKSDAEAYAATASREFNSFRQRYGALDSDQLNVVELPGGTVPAYWAPEIAALAGAQMQGATAPRLLANTIAHQWWGNRVSPAAMADAWIANGMSRYAELAYVQQSSGEAALQQAVLDTSAAALAYDTAPLTDAGRFPESSPEFQAMTYDKGAMIFRMLQWQLGDAAFEATLRRVLSQAVDASISSQQLEADAAAISQENLHPFFAQWLDSTGAPTLQAKWTMYRLGNNRGFRTMGSIDQDLDLFRMPVQMRVETEGKTVTQRVNVSGPHSQFAIDTFGMPRKVSLDPEHWLLRNGPSMSVRVHVLRGQQQAAKKNFVEAVEEYRRALSIDPTSSLASYRLGNAYFAEHNYQAAADAYRDALRGDDKPAWIEVWSDLQLGEVFDVSGQRERAVTQYREALQTGDDTGGALGLARAYLQRPYKPASGSPQ
ncbi:MAG: M1 family aminopeptidase [Acidobacteriaceae bacterium]